MKQRIVQISPVAGEAEISFDAQEIDECLSRISGRKPSGNDAVFQMLADKAVDLLTADKELCIVNMVKVADSVITDGNNCIIMLKFEKLPEVKLPATTENLSVHVGAPVVEPEIFYDTLLRLQRAYADIQEVTEVRNPQKGDVAIVDVDASFEGRRIGGLCANSLPIRFGDQHAPEVLQRIISEVPCGKTGYGEMTCPGDYIDSSLRGKPIALAVTLKRLQLEKLPALDDAFARRLGHKDFKIFQEKMYKTLLNAVVVGHRRHAEEALLDSLLEGQEFPIPASLQRIHTNAVAMQRRTFLQKKGLQGELLEAAMADAAEEDAAHALKQARRQVFLMRLAYREKFVVTSDDVDTAIKSLAEDCGRNPKELGDEIRNSAAIYELQDRLLAEKGLRYLYANVRKVVVDKNDVPVQQPRNHWSGQ